MSLLNNILNQKISLCFSFVILISLSSCVSTNRGFQSSPVVTRNVDIDPIKADIQVNDKKVSGQSTSLYLKFFVPIFRLSGDRTTADGISYSSNLIYPSFINNTLVGNVRAAAAYKALENTDADILVNANYTVTIDDSFFIKKIIVTVTGYPGVYKNFKSEEVITVFSKNENLIIVSDK